MSNDVAVIPDTPAAPITPSPAAPASQTPSPQPSSPAAAPTPGAVPPAASATPPQTPTAPDTGGTTPDFDRFVEYRKPDGSVAVARVRDLIARGASFPDDLKPEMVPELIALNKIARGDNTGWSDLQRIADPGAVARPAPTQQAPAVDPAIQQQLDSLKAQLAQAMVVVDVFKSARTSNVLKQTIAGVAEQYPLLSKAPNQEAIVESHMKTLCAEMQARNLRPEQLTEAEKMQVLNIAFTRAEQEIGQLLSAYGLTPPAPGQQKPAAAQQPGPMLVDDQGPTSDSQAPIMPARYTVGPGGMLYNAAGQMVVQDPTGRMRVMPGQMPAPNAGVSPGTGAAAPASPNRWGPTGIIDRVRQRLAGRGE